MTRTERERLNKYATKFRARYCVGDSLYPRPAAEALAIIDACLALNAPVTDRITATAWTSLVSRVLALEAG